VWRLDLGVGPEALAVHRACLSRDELARAARFRRAEDAARYVAARGALRRVLGDALGRPPAALAFAVGPYGKPRLAPPDDRADLAFNVAHCEGVALIALARGAEIGVDVERIRPGVEVDRLAARLFSSAERRQLAALPPEAAYEAFFALWAAKEAVVKALGRGLFARLDGFDVRLDAAGRLLPQRVEIAGSGGSWWLASADAGDAAYPAAVAVAGEERAIEVFPWPQADAVG